jgi:hypothetical protein
MATTTFGGSIEAELTVPASVTVSATSNAGGPTVVAITPGTYASLTALMDTITSDLNTQRPVTGGSWVVRNATGASSGFYRAGGSVTLQIGVSAGTCSLTWTSTDLRDLVWFTSNIASSQLISR